MNNVRSPFARWPEVLLAISVGFMFGMVLRVMAQDAKPEAKPDKPAEKIVIKSEVDRYHYQSLAAKYALDEQQVSNLVLQFLNSNENAKTIRAHQVEVMNELTPLRKKMFEDHKLSPDQYDIQGDPPEFVLIKK